MKSISIESDNGIFGGSIQLYIQDTKHLDVLTKNLRKIEGVEEVVRFDVH
jgi:guanosine-3',5'-bis(diphosphate) 3'-pyrophosphohydrolase